MTVSVFDDVILLDNLRTFIKTAANLSTQQFLFPSTTTRKLLYHLKSLWTDNSQKMQSIVNSGAEIACRQPCYKISLCQNCNYFIVSMLALVLNVWVKPWSSSQLRSFTSPGPGRKLKGSSLIPYTGNHLSYTLSSEKRCYTGSFISQ